MSRIAASSRPATLVRYNNEPQFFVADASAHLGLVADVMERLAPSWSRTAIYAHTLSRLRDAVQLIERRTTRARDRARCARSISL